MTNNNLNFSSGIVELSDEMLESVVGGTSSANVKLPNPTSGASNPYGHPRNLISTDIKNDTLQLGQLKLQDKKLELQMQGLRNDIQQDKMALKKLH